MARKNAEIVASLTGTPTRPPEWGEWAAVSPAGALVWGGTFDECLAHYAEAARVEREHAEKSPEDTGLYTDVADVYDLRGLAA